MSTPNVFPSDYFPADYFSPGSLNANLGLELVRLKESRSKIELELDVMKETMRRIDLLMGLAAAAQK